MERHERGEMTGWAFLFVVVVFLMFALWGSPKTKEFGLEGGDIEKAIQEQQYR